MSPRGDEPSPAAASVGPDEGFFYDFVVERPFVPEDLEAIERKMKELAAQDLVYERQMWPRDEATAFFEKRGEPLKMQLIDEKTAGQKDVSVYTIKDRDTFVDFCVGPHVPSTGKLKAFKLLTNSNAYWKGDARNQPMQRVYGTAFLSEKDLKAHLPSSKRRRSAITASSDASSGSSPSPVGAGATFWQDRGRRSTTPRRLHARRTDPDGYVEVKTPLVYNRRCGSGRPLAALSREHVPHRIRERADGVKAMTAPAITCSTRARRTAIASCRCAITSRRAAPQRGVGRALGADRVRSSRGHGHCFVPQDQSATKSSELGLVRRVYGDFGSNTPPSCRPSNRVHGEIATGTPPRRS